MSNKNKKLTIKDELTEFLLYTAPDGEVKVEIVFHNDNAWLTINRMAELFDTTKQNISQHLQSVFAEEELDKKATVKKFLTVRKEGDREVSRELEFYNLDAIIAT